MTYPVNELIAQNILTTIQGVTTGNGYNYTLSAQRHTRAGDKVAHLNAVIIQEDPKEVPDPKVYNTKEWLLTFHVGVFVIPEEQDTTPIDQYVNLIAADVHKALMVDRYRGGYALDTQIRPSYKSAEEGLKYECIVIPAEVNYRTNELNPYQQA
jgi:hypothetical protein